MDHPQWVMSITTTFSFVATLVVGHVAGRSINVGGLSWFSAVVSALR
jgi:hypothetical protein